MDSAKIAIRASTQQHLDIEDIRDNLVILKDGSCSLILSTTAINFGLLSEAEQDATIYTYAAMLNSLGFPIQLLIRSQKKDVSGYVHLLDQAEAKESKREIKEQIIKYKKFVEEIVAKNEVLDKKFYLIIPMSSLEVGLTKAFTSSFGFKKGFPFSIELILEKAKTNLFPKRDHLLRQLNRLGLKARQLNTQELIQLFFEIYNPESPRQPASQFTEYQSPIVETVNKETAKGPDREIASNPKNLQDEISNLVKKSTT